MTNRKVAINDIDILFITAGLIALVDNENTDLLNIDQSLKLLCITEQSLRLLETLRSSKKLNNVTRDCLEEAISAIADEHSKALDIYRKIRN